MATTRSGGRGGNSEARRGALNSPRRGSGRPAYIKANGSPSDSASRAELFAPGNRNDDDESAEPGSDYTSQDTSNGSSVLDEPSRKPLNSYDGDDDEHVGSFFDDADIDSLLDDSDDDYGVHTHNPMPYRFSSHSDESIGGLSGIIDDSDDDYGHNSDTSDNGAGNNNAKPVSNVMYDNAHGNLSNGKPDSSDGALNDSMRDTLRTARGALADKAAEQGKRIAGSAARRFLRRHPLLALGIIAAVFCAVIIICVAVGVILGMSTGSSGSGNVIETSSVFVPKMNVNTDSPSNNNNANSNSAGTADASGWTLFKQGDDRWGSEKFGSMTYKAAGCWITSYAMIWTKYSGQEHTPVDVWNSCQNGALSPRPFISSGLGQRPSIASSLNNLNIGLSCTKADNGSINMDTVDEVLAGGGCVFEYREGTHNHATVIAGKKDDSTYLVADPATGEMMSYQIDHSSGDIISDYTGNRQKLGGNGFVIYCRKV